MTTHSARRSRSFGEDAERYDRARPSYPSAMVSELLAGRRLRVLDIGCGTGIASRSFITHGCEVHGVEHDPRMAGMARESGIDVEVIAFESWVPPESGFDLAISAQAWHWIDPVIGPLRASEALVPGGRLAIFWLEYRHPPEVQSAFASIYGDIAPDLLGGSFPAGALPPAHHQDLSAKYSAQLHDCGAFQPATTHTYLELRRYSGHQWLEELPTHSDHRTLPEDQLQALLSALKQSIATLGEDLQVGLKTHLVLAAAPRT